MMFVNTLRAEGLQFRRMAVRSHNHRWDEKAQSWRCQMTKEVFEALFFIGALLGGFFWHRVKQFFRWLKGSRTSYYIDPYGDFHSWFKFNGSFPKEYRTGQWPIKGLLIEINRGPFRRRSAIYGPAAKNWKIAKASLGCNAQGGFGAEWVDLVDCSSLPVERALRLVNTYPSLQAMLDRVAELETRLADSQGQLKNKSAGVKAILRLINQDRSLYRSKTSGWIRQWLYTLDHSDLNEALPSAQEIKDWEDRFRIMTS